MILESNSLNAGQRTTHTTPTTKLTVAENISHIYWLQFANSPANCRHTFQSTLSMQQSAKKMAPPLNWNKQDRPCVKQALTSASRGFNASLPAPSANLHLQVMGESIQHITYKILQIQVMSLLIFVSVISVNLTMACLFVPDERI